MSNRRRRAIKPAAFLACALLALPLGIAAPQPVAVHTFEEFLPNVLGYPAFIGGTYPGYWYSAFATCSPSVGAPTCHVMGDATIDAPEIRSFEATFYSDHPDISSIQVRGHGEDGVDETSCAVGLWSVSHCKLGPGGPYWRIEVRGPINDYHWGFDSVVFTHTVQPPPDVDLDDVRDRKVVLQVG